MRDKKKDSEPNPSFTDFLAFWQNKTPGTEIQDFSRYIESNPLLENVLSLGPSFVYMLNYKTMKYGYISSNIKNILGFDSKEIMEGGPALIYDRIHPEDLTELMNVTFKSILDFYFSTEITERKKVRCSYDYRVKRADGKYIRLLQQTVVVDIDQQGNPLADIGIISEITEYKKENTINLILSRYDQHSGFSTLNTESPSPVKKDRVSEREIEILKLLMQGYSSKKIADELHISVNTVRNHRQNLLEKTKTKNIAELITFALSNSLI